eukprot:CAMPEP_0170603112 /NCGR_PEP_ID=MMETSP0224-20130122/18743_1 /TAXON_ID=285029 /ORGANISM="Togula jolla, Strain CCCM 725" /LENGTH=446 /DNA_ID=CAMNT_0010927981 /DNA_START=105 /DNA_END=1445 /DNA_ORIENTATION=+
MDPLPLSEGHSAHGHDALGGVELSGEVRFDIPVAQEAATNQGVEGHELHEHMSASSSEAALRKTLNISVVTMGGTNVATVVCSASTTVYELKQILARMGSDGVGVHRLVHGVSVLEDSQTLSCCCSVENEPGLEEEVTLTSILMCPSAISSFLADMNSPCLSATAALAEFADSVFQSEYSDSEKARPSVDAVLMVPEERANLIGWMVEAFDVMQFSDSILFSALLTLDRYCACLTAIPETKSYGHALLAAVCTEMKLANADKYGGSWQHYIRHLCQNRFALPEILEKEREVLSTLNFAVGVPTSLTFFSGLSLRQRPALPNSRCFELGLLLLHVALFDVKIQYNFPHVVIAAAALSAGLSICDEPEIRREEVLEDLSAYCLCMESMVQLVEKCEEELLDLWMQCASGRSEWSEWYLSVHRKFSSPFHKEVTELHAAARLRGLRQMS